MPHMKVQANKWIFLCLQNFNIISWNIKANFGAVVAG